MRISKAGIEFIKEFEGFRAEPYYCSGNKRTIGYGHVILKGEKFGKITVEQAEEILKQDLYRFEETVRQSVKVPLSQNQFDALVSFTFNLGGYALGRSTLLKKLNTGDYSGAASEFSKWVFAGGKKLKGLERRRKAEKEMFLKNA